MKKRRNIGIAVPTNLLVIGLAVALVASACSGGGESGTGAPASDVAGAKKVAERLVKAMYDYDAASAADLYSPFVRDEAQHNLNGAVAFLEAEGFKLLKIRGSEVREFAGIGWVGLRVDVYYSTNVGECVAEIVFEPVDQGLSLFSGVSYAYGFQPDDEGYGCVDGYPAYYRD